MIRYFMVAVFFLASCVSLVSWPTSSIQDQEKEKKNVIPAQELSDSIARKDFMRAKMMYSQNIFAGLVAGDFDALEKAVAEIKSITDAAQWVAIENKEYQELTAEFTRSAERLMKAVKSKNIDATALRFYELSTSCIDCHQHIRVAAYEL